MNTAIETEEELEERLSRPADADVAAMSALEGDILILGAAGKMGPSLAILARRAVQQAGLTKRITAVARFSKQAVRQQLQENGIETIASNLLHPGALQHLPDAPNVIFMAAKKFGTTGAEHETWAMNTYLPGLVADRFRHSRIVAFSTGNVYGLQPVAKGGAIESTPVAPVGEYAQSALGRERMFEYASAEWGTRVVLIRLNYAVELRYGVLVDIANSVFNRQPVNLSMGLVNFIWQRDANSMCLRAFAHCQSPPLVLNVTGPETLSVRYIAEQFGRQVPYRSGLHWRRSVFGSPEQCRRGAPALRLSERHRGRTPGFDRALDLARRIFAEQTHTFRSAGWQVLMNVRERLQHGLVIPAHPLALNAQRRLDERRQRALTRYYLAAGAGGIAVGVHTTQFAIRSPEVALLKPVLELAAEETQSHDIVRIAGVCGHRKQAVAEAELASSLGYQAVLLSMAALAQASIPELLEHARAVSSVLPVIGFYLQPSVGGRALPYEFWRQFAGIPNVVAIKVAPFNRYQTLDVVRAVAESGRAGEIALYTGNDDNIVIDLLTGFEFGGVQLRFAGGLLGHWAVWTRGAALLLEAVKKVGDNIPATMLTLSQQITDANAAFFDPAHNFHGCIAGIHEVLRRHGLMEGRWCLGPREDLSDGQSGEIDRVWHSYPHLHREDDLLIRDNLDTWLK